MVSTTVRVQIDLEAERHPVVEVRRVLPSDPGVDVPVDVLAAYTELGAAHRRAERRLLEAAGYHLDGAGEWTLDAIADVSRETDDGPRRSFAVGDRVRHLTQDQGDADRVHGTVEAIYPSALGTYLVRFDDDRVLPLLSTELTKCSETPGPGHPPSWTFSSPPRPRHDT